MLCLFNLLLNYFVGLGDLDDREKLSKKRKS